MVDSYLIFCAAVVGKIEDGKNSFLGGGHAVMIPFQITSLVIK
jgi:hypothetical protein